MLHEDIKTETKQALKEGDKTKLSVLRNIKTEMTNELVETGHTPQDTLDDEKALEVIGRLAKQRKDSIEQFKEGGRDDLVETEEAELEILEEYLPEQLSKEEIEPVVREKVEELGTNDMSDMGKLMGAVMGELKGQADGNDVREVVEKVLKG